MWYDYLKDKRGRCNCTRCRMLNATSDEEREALMDSIAANRTIVGDPMASNRAKICAQKELLKEDK